jgi:hypothetical protein
MKLTEHLNLLAQFHPSKNDRPPCAYTSGESKTKIWWQCPIAKDHVWPARFADRLQLYKRKGSQFHDDGGTVGCPFCAPNAKPSSTNNLAKNRPEIAKEWDYEKNGGLTPENITTHSGRTVYWICAKGHSYHSSVHDRTRGDNPSSCPDCSTKNSSPEFRIIAELETIIADVQHRVKIHHYEADIFLPALKLAVEYDGEYYHGSEKKDRLKNDFFKAEGITLIRVREGNLKKIDENDICTGTKRLKKEAINDLFSSLAVLRPTEIAREKVENYISKSDFLNKKRFYDLLSNIKSVSNQNALLIKFPMLVERWDYERNGNLDPFSVSSGDAQLEVFFVCETHGQYSRTPYSISSLVNPEPSLGCKKCSGRAPSAERNLAFGYPKLSREFAYDLNGELTPENLTPGSSRNVWWRCKNGHEFQRIIKHRTKKGDDDKCPHCKSHPRARN